MVLGRYKTIEQMLEDYGFDIMRTNLFNKHLMSFRLNDNVPCICHFHIENNTYFVDNMKEYSNINEATKVVIEIMRQEVLDT